jgi:hypothetical protein
MGQLVRKLPCKVYDWLGEAIEILVEESYNIYDEQTWSRLANLLYYLELKLEEPGIHHSQEILEQIERLCTLIDLHPCMIMIKDKSSFDCYCDLYRSMGSISKDSDDDDDDSDDHDGSVSSDSNGYEHRRGYHPKAVVQSLQTWFREHLDYPYPSDKEKASLCMETQLTHSQINQWFINARRRHVNFLEKI